MQMDNFQGLPLREQKHMTTDDQFQITIRSLLDTLAYQSAVNQLKSLSMHEDIGLANRRRLIAGRIVKNHLQSMYQIFSSPNQLANSIDIDVMIDLISYTITSYTQDNDECLALDTLLKIQIKQDFKYAFLVFRPKYLNFDIEKNDYESQVIRKIKFFTSSHMFIPQILNAPNTSFEDFIEMIKQPMNLFHTNNNEDPQIMNEQANKQQRQRSSVYEAYLNFCNKILQPCVKYIKQSDETKIKREKLYTIIVNCISNLLLVTDSDSNQWSSERLKNIKWQISCIIKSQPNPLQFKNLKFFSQLFLISIAKNECLSSIINKNRLLYLLSRILMKYSPQYTTGSKVGTTNEKMDAFLQQIVIFVCNTLLNSKNKSWIKIEGQKIYIDEGTWIDLIPIYKRMLVLLGFMSPQHSKQCAQLVKQVLKFDTDRYRICPLPRIFVWQQLMKLAGNSEIDYRIFCISEYRKLLIQQKNQMVKGTFQSHPYHTHSGIFVNAYQTIQNQMEILMLFGITNINCDYIGHVISLMSNWLICVKTYCNKYNSYHNKKLAQLKKEVEKQANKLQQKISKHLEVIKQENAVTQHELILFRCKQLDFA